MKKSPGEKKEHPIERPSSAVPIDVDGVSPTSDGSEPFTPAAESLWLVTVEGRYNVIRVCTSGRGFYIPGQEPCWPFDHVDEWIREIIPQENVVKREPEVIELCPKCNKQVTGTGVFRRCRNTRCEVVKVHIDLVKEIPLHAYRYTHEYQKQFY